MYVSPFYTQQDTAATWLLPIERALKINIFSIIGGIPTVNFGIQEEEEREVSM